MLLTGDGELAEGNNWEALMSATKYKLDNLTWIVDRNHLQISGNTEEVMPIENLKEKAQAFGFKQSRSMVMIMIRFQMRWIPEKKESRYASSLIPSKEKDFPVRKTRLAGTIRLRLWSRWNSSGQIWLN